MVVYWFIALMNLAGVFIKVEFIRMEAFVFFAEWIPSSLWKENFLGISWASHPLPCLVV